MTVHEPLDARRAPEARRVDIHYDAAQYTSFPHLARCRRGELLVAFRQAPRETAPVMVDNKDIGHRHTHPRSVITVLRSMDGGESWDADGASQLAAGGGQELGLISLGEDRVGGALAKHRVAMRSQADRAGLGHGVSGPYVYQKEGVYYVWSEDGGVTWPLRNARLVSSPDANPCAPPVLLQQGDLLLPAYGRAQSRDEISALLYRSNDGGTIWSEPVIMAMGDSQTRSYNEPALVEVKPGHLRALHRIENVRTGTPKVFWTNESDDSGRTWTRPSETGIVSGACPRLLSLRDGRLLLTFGRRVPPFGIMAMLSEDGGDSWGKTTWMLHETPDSDQGYTSSLEMRDGQVLTASYCKNADGVTGIVGIFWRLP